MPTAGASHTMPEGVQITLHLKFEVYSSSPRLHLPTAPAPAPVRHTTDEMAAVSTLAPRDVPTTLNYFELVGEGPAREYATPGPDGKRRSNVGKDPHPAVVHDVRGREDAFTLDGQGFQFVHWPSAEKEFVDEEAIRTRYYAEVEALLKEATGAKRVFIFDHTIRYVLAGVSGDHC